jgi:hypothetical protein
VTIYGEANKQGIKKANSKITICWERVAVISYVICIRYELSGTGWRFSNKAHNKVPFFRLITNLSEYICFKPSRVPQIVQLIHDNQRDR